METVTVKIDKQSDVGKAVLSMLEFFRKQGSGIEFVEDNLTQQDQDFELSEKQKQLLDQRLKEDKKNFVPARQALQQLRGKYGL